MNIKSFREWCTEAAKKLPRGVWVLFNNQRAHLNATTLTILHDKGIHILSPLDNVLFSQVKKAFRAHSYHRMRSLLQSQASTRLWCEAASIGAISPITNHYQRFVRM